MTANAILIMDGRHGVHLPRLFVEQYEQNILNMHDVAAAVYDIKQGLNNEFYWEAWSDLLDRAIIVKLTNRAQYILHQNDGDLWGIPVEEIEFIPE